MKGFKATNINGKCRGQLFKVGKTYEVIRDLVLCINGFHFCEKLGLIN